MSVVKRVADMAEWIREVRRVTGDWPKALILHPTASLDEVRQAIAQAKTPSPIEIMEQIIQEALARDPKFYDPPELVERTAAQMLQQATRRKRDSYASTTRFKPYGAYGSNSSPVPLDWQSRSSNSRVWA